MIKHEDLLQFNDPIYRLLVLGKRLLLIIANILIVDHLVRIIHCGFQLLDGPHFLFAFL